MNCSIQQLAVVVVVVVALVLVVVGKAVEVVVAAEVVELVSDHWLVILPINQDRHLQLTVLMGIINIIIRT